MAMKYEKCKDLLLMIYIATIIILIIVMIW